MDVRFGYDQWRRGFVASFVAPAKPDSVSVTPEEWEQGVRVWADYCTSTNVGERHFDMCMRLVGEKS